MQQILNSKKPPAIKSIIDSFNPLADDMVQVLNELGEIVNPDLMPNWSDDKFREVYSLLVLFRRADQKLVNLQRQGRSGTYPSIEGQEACQVGSVLALEKSDWIFPAFRELAACHMHGLPLEKIFLYWMGNEWGSHTDACVAPVSIPVGSHPLHAAGYAWGAKLQKKPIVTVSYFGDGATSTGDFYEAMNFAGVFKIPTIFVCQNNQWAISIPRSRQSAAATLAQKALACGIPGIQVDGNDVFASFSVMAEAVKRCHAGLGATFIEMVTYRLGNHTTSDDALRYRKQEEVDGWRKKDPIIRLKLFMQQKNLWDEKFQEKIEAEADEKIRQAVEKAESTPKPKPDEIFDFMYETLTPALEEQKKYLKTLNK